jgi:hypothetical protein
MIGAWKRLKTLSGAALRLERFSSSSSESAATSAITLEHKAEAPVKYENVRKLLVGLGNPGDKYTKTRCVVWMCALPCDRLGQCGNGLFLGHG